VSNDVTSTNTTATSTATTKTPSAVAVEVSGTALDGAAIAKKNGDHGVVASVDTTNTAPENGTDGTSEKKLSKSQLKKLEKNKVKKRRNHEFCPVEDLRSAFIDHKSYVVWNAM
jgi:hypothetical protein